MHPADMLRKLLRAQRQHGNPLRSVYRQQPDMPDEDVEACMNVLAHHLAQKSHIDVIYPKILDFYQEIGRTMRVSMHKKFLMQLLFGLFASLTQRVVNKRPPTEKGIQAFRSCCAAAGEEFDEQMRKLLQSFTNCKVPPGALKAFIGTVKKAGVQLSAMYWLALVRAHLSARELKPALELVKTHRLTVPPEDYLSCSRCALEKGDWGVAAEAAILAGSPLSERRILTAKGNHAFRGKNLRLALQYFLEADDEDGLMRLASRAQEEGHADIARAASAGISAVA